MNKIIFTLNINNYAPEIREVTRPNLEHWADKIDAKIVDITEPVLNIPHAIGMEKFQIYELAKQYPADWYIYIDSDAFVSNDMPDVVEMVGKETVITGRKMSYTPRWRIDDVFRRYQAMYGACDMGTWFVAVSDWCLDVWNPNFDIGWAKAGNENIFNITLEKNAPAPQDPHHILDDYFVSRNVARYGMKVDYLDQLAGGTVNMIAHQCYDVKEVKLAYLSLLKEMQTTYHQSLLEGRDINSINQAKAIMAWLEEKGYGQMKKESV